MAHVSEAAAIIALLRELVAEQRRAADALEKIATAPTGALPPRRSKARRVHAAPPAKNEPDELTQARARKALERMGLR